MNRCDLLKATSMSIAAAGLSGYAEEIPGVMRQGAKSNLLFVMTGQQRFDTLNCAGNTFLKTPNLAAVIDPSSLICNVLSWPSVSLS